jgi:hypothetical protein
MTTKNINNILVNFMNKPMFVSNSSRPISAKILFQWFWFAQSLKKISVNIYNEFIYSVKNLWIYIFPFQIIYKRSKIKLNRFHLREFITVDKVKNSSSEKEIEFALPIFSTAFSILKSVPDWVSFLKNVLSGTEKEMVNSYVLTDSKYFFKLSTKVAVS